MHLLPAIICAAFFFMAPAAGFAGVELYSGTMNITAVSGKGCAGALGTHDVSLAIRRDSEGSVVNGYFEGQGITLGRFSGTDNSPLEVRYPLNDESRAAGHFLTVVRVDSGIHAELRDRHIDATEEECNFDLATMTLDHVAGGQAAETRFNQLADSFEAQLLRSRGLSLVRAKRYDEAVPLFEKALALAERSGGGDSDQLVPYVTVLANTYVKLGWFDQFNRLYEQRFGSINSEGAKVILSGHRIRALLLSGKDSLLREEHGAALEDFMEAYRLQPQSREAVAAVMMAHLRTEDYDKAIGFLEEVAKSADSEIMRQDVKSALAQVYSFRARKQERKGELALAESDLKRAEALEPRVVTYLIALARLRHISGSLAEAEKILKKGSERFTQESDRQQIIAARERMRQIESMLVKIRHVRG